MALGKIATVEEGMDARKRKLRSRRTAPKSSDVMSRVCTVLYDRRTDRGRKFKTD